MTTRRGFLGDVGKGMLAASIGPALAADLGLFSAFAEGPDELTFGKMEPLAALLQETPLDKLQSTLVGLLEKGVDLKTLVAAGSLANARSFGGRHYEGYHTFMALAPAYEMSRELPEASRAMPILKVLYRNSTHIQAKGGRKNDELHPVEATALPEGKSAGAALVEATRKGERDRAEGMFATVAKQPPREAFDELQPCVHDDINVHRVVLAWRAWMMLDYTGPEHAHTLLRQSVLFACKEINNHAAAIQALLPKLIDGYKLAGKKPGTKHADDKWVADLSRVIYSQGRERAADAVAAALAEGISPEAIGEAMSMAATRLVLCDPGRKKTDGFKQAGSVHGDSPGVHASDAANAWRHIARVSSPANAIASLIVGAYHTAGQQTCQLADAYPTGAATEAAAKINGEDVLKTLDAAIKDRDQAAACALAKRYGTLERPVRPLLDVMLKYAVSEDGALHAEKYYRTASEEFAAARPAFRWDQMAALARVTASESGKPAPGQDEARRLLKA